MLIDKQEAKENFRTVLMTRTAIAFAGAGILAPQPHLFLQVVIAIGNPNNEGCAIDSTIPAKDQDWRLYEVYTDEEDPLKRIMMPSWAVIGAAVATGDEHIKVEKIEPEAWYGNLHAVLNNMPPALATPQVFALADQLIEWTQKCPPENLRLVKEAMKAKGEAIQALRDGLRPPPTEDCELHVVVISL